MKNWIINIRNVYIWSSFLEYIFYNIQKRRRAKSCSKNRFYNYRRMYRTFIAIQQKKMNFTWDVKIISMQANAHSSKQRFIKKLIFKNWDSCETFEIRVKILFTIAVCYVHSLVPYSYNTIGISRDTWKSSE